MQMTVSSKSFIASALRLSFSYFPIAIFDASALRLSSSSLFIDIFDAFIQIYTYYRNFWKFVFKTTAFKTQPSGILS